MINRDSWIVMLYSSGSQTFRNRGPLHMTLTISWHLGYAISRQSYVVKASARDPQKTAPPREAEGPVWETLFCSISKRGFHHPLQLCLQMKVDIVLFSWNAP